MRQWWAKIRAFCTGRRELSSELRQELEAHLEMEIQENRARGVPEQEAERLARGRFGNMTLIQEDAREAWRFTPIENLAKDVRYAARTLRKSPGYAVTAVLTLALGIGGTTAMFSVIRTVLLKPLDYPDPDRLVEVLVSGARRGQPDYGLNRIQYLEMQAAPAFSGFGAASGIRELVTLSSDGSEPEPVREARVSANFLQILGVKPILGRGFLPAEDRPGGANVALISYRVWKRRFGGNANVFRSTISLNEQPYTVIGVLPPQFEYPWSDYDVWVTRPWEWAEVPPEAWDRVGILRGLARLKPGVTLQEARAQLNVIRRQYVLTHRTFGGAASDTIDVERLQDSLVRDLRTLLWMLFDAVGLVLLIVCANLSGLLLARSAARLREFAVRSALGAARRRLIQQTLAESVLLALAGAVMGVVFAEGILSAVKRFVPLDVPHGGAIHIDGAVLVFTGVVSIVTGLGFGCLPSLRFSRPDLADFLREQGALAGRTSGSHASSFRMRGFLVVAQIALSIVLLSGVGLMLESFFRLREVDPGFQPAHLLTMEIALPTGRYNTEQKKQAFWDDLVKRVEGIPGVVGSAVSRSVPTTIPDLLRMQVLEQPKPPRGERTMPNVQSATLEYFRVFGIPLIRGREFTPQDRAGATLVAIINERLARRFWPAYPRGPNPVGQHLLAGNYDKKTSWKIVGIAGDVHEDALATDVRPEAYLPVAQSAPQTGYLTVRTIGASEGLAAAVRRQVIAIDPGQSVSDISTMTQRLSKSLGGRWRTLILLGSFAGVALIIALLGIYGVMAYLVVERTQEFGIRQALGAQPGDLLKLVVGRGLRLLLGGLGVGIAGSLAVARVMRGMLFQVSPTDPWLYLAISFLFLIAGLAACYLPARRATRMSVSSALRY